MKTMSDYTIYCTSSQTKKALELGAPIAINAITNEPMCIYTAEQMIGWLEEQGGIRCVEVTESFGWHYRVKKKHDDVEDWIQGTCHTRPEATLAAIDAALEYLINNK